MAEPNPHNPTDAAAAPGAPPRAMTPRAASRAWREPAVRFWWMTGLILLLIAAYLMVSGYLTWRHQTKLITEGLAVDATVDSIDGLAVAGAQRPVESYIAITYVVNGQTIQSVGPPAHPRALVTVKQTIPIRVDPQNPRVWTAQTEPMRLSGKFIGPAIALGIMVVTLLVAAQRRRRVARIWREGAARPATVVTTRQSGFAPLSHAIDCSLSDTRDKSVYTVYLPHRLGRPRAGEGMWLIVHPRWPRHALAAIAFDEPPARPASDRRGASSGAGAS